MQKTEQQVSIAELGRIEEALGYSLSHFVETIQNAANSCVLSEVVNAFIQAARLNEVMPLPAEDVEYDIPELLGRLDLKEGTCGWFAFSSIDGGVDVDYMSSHGKGACYGDGKTDAIYGEKPSENGFVDNTILVDTNACAVLDDVFDCVQNLAASIGDIINDHFDYLPMPDAADATYELHVAPIVIRIQVTGAEVVTMIDQRNSDPTIVTTTDDTWAADVIDQVVIRKVCNTEVLEYDTVLVTKMVRWNDGTTHPESRVYTLDELMGAAKRTYGVPFGEYRTCA